VIGLAELLANFARVELELDVAAHAGLDAAAQSVARAWVANIEADGLVLTGRYRDSITVDASGEEATVSTDVPYAGILEYGDSRQEAHPVAQRAFDEHQGEALDTVGKALAAVIA
jgi:HK97 gp10 family phage protein